MNEEVSRGSVQAMALSLFCERVSTPTGAMTIVTDEAGALRALDWEDRCERMMTLLRRHGAEGASLSEPGAATEARRGVEAYFAGELHALDMMETVTAGTPFQCAVWRALRNIPVGEVVSYGALAAAIERPSAVRAVGLANGANPIAIVTPCHRVIGANKALTGYAGGLWRKRWLLDHERARLS